MEPFFSVLIPTYNRPDFLRACIDSVLASDCEDYEIVLSDDCSPGIEEIAGIIEPYLKEHRNVSFVRQSRNLGMAENWNFLVKKARGEYVILMGDDDKLMPSTLRRIREFIETKPDRHIYALGYTVIDENDKHFYSCCSPVEFEIHLGNSKLVRTLFFADIIPFWTFHSFAMCCQRTVYETINYEKGAHIGADLLFLMDLISCGGRIFVIPELLFQWRKAQTRQGHYRNLSSDGMNNIIARRNILSILRTRHYSSALISGLSATFEFRKRFLLNSIVLGGYAHAAGLKNVALDDDDIREILRQSRYPRVLYKVKVLARFVFDYLNLFGIKGLGCLLNRFFAKALYKLKHTWSEVRDYAFRG